jgi:hypothetical protein
MNLLERIISLQNHKTYNDKLEKYKSSAQDVQISVVSDSDEAESKSWVKFCLISELQMEYISGITLLENTVVEGT